VEVLKQQKSLILSDFLLNISNNFELFLTPYLPMQKREKMV
jgi:hypothetical protein